MTEIKIRDDVLETKVQSIPKKNQTRCERFTQHWPLNCFSLYKTGMLKYGIHFEPYGRKLMIDLYELFAEDVSVFTPVLAKRQGYDLLTLFDREIKLKEKYFNEMNLSAGSSLAARFLMWEDYYSTVCKLDALVGNP